MKYAPLLTVYATTTFKFICFFANKALVAA